MTNMGSNGVSLKGSTYEIELPFRFDTVNFENNVKGGKGNLWMVCTEHEPDFWRFRGFMNIPGPTKGSIRLFIDVNADGLGKSMYVTTPAGQSMTPLEVASAVFKEVRGTRMFLDGNEVNV